MAFVGPSEATETFNVDISLEVATGTWPLILPSALKATQKRKHYFLMLLEGLTSLGEYRMSRISFV